MHKLLVTIAALLCLPTLALAKTAKLAPADTVASLDFPDSWKISTIKRGLQAKSPDEEVYVWAELVPGNEVDTLQKEHDEYFEKQKVTISKAEPEGKEIDGKKWAFVTPEAKYKGDPTFIRHIIINPKVESGKIIIFTYWASPEGDKNYNEEMDRVINSLRASLSKT